jgi:hypothetical protein
MKKLSTLALVGTIVLAGPLAQAHSKRHHQYHHHHAVRCPGGPNGAAGGPTSLSGTGPSTSGANIPGAAGCSRP